MTTNISPNSSPEKTIKPKVTWEQGVRGMVILSMVLSIISLFISLKKTISSFGVVDIQRLVHEQSKHLAKESPSGKIDLKRLQQTADTLKSSLETWAHSHHMILFEGDGVGNHGRGRV